jgi:DNA polymerase-1
MPVDSAKNYAQKIRLMMEAAATLSVPLIVDIGIGNSWQEAH